MKAMASDCASASDRLRVARMAVAPAHPEDGILEMSGGQSGHFLSPNLADQQRDWLSGEPAAFLAGGARWHLKLR